MDGFLEALRVQRWDDHRYYHHSRINQSLHLGQRDQLPVRLCHDVHGSGRGGAGRLAGGDDDAGRPVISSSSPRTTTTSTRRRHEYKEEIKVGYNLQRKVVLMTIWALSPLPLYFDPTLFGIFTPHAGSLEFVRHVGDDLARRSASAGCCSAPSSCSSSRTCRPAWCGRPRSSPTRSTTSSSTTRRRSTCCAAS